MMDEPLTMIIIDEFAPVMLAAIRDILPAHSWTIYLILVYELLAQGDNKDEHATRLKLFLPHYPDIALFHNTFADLTNSTTLEDAGSKTYTKIPQAAVPGYTPDIIRDGFGQLCAKFVMPVPQDGRWAQQIDHHVNMESLTQALDGVSIAPVCDSEPMHMADGMVISYSQDSGCEADAELDAKLEPYGLSPEEFELVEMEPSVTQARSEAMEYLESLNPFGARDPDEMASLMREIAQLGLN